MEGRLEVRRIAGGSCSVQSCLEEGGWCCVLLDQVCGLVRLLEALGEVESDGGVLREAGALRRKLVILQMRKSMRRLENVRLVGWWSDASVAIFRVLCLQGCVLDNDQV